MQAACRAARGKRAKPGAAAFLANLETEVLRLERELRSGRYQPGRYRKIEVFDPKHRIVSAAPFRDRVVHTPSVRHASRSSRTASCSTATPIASARTRTAPWPATKEDVIRRMRSWVAHAEHANTWRLRQAIFRASRFGAA